jgi:hypothetical protein
MVLTASGYVLLFLCGLAVGLFCWLSYACLSRTQRAAGAAGDKLLASRADEITGAISHGSG